MGALLPPVAPLPSPKHEQISTGVSLLRPLSRRGTGPGLIVLVHENKGSAAYDGLGITDGVPSPLMKWAEEGYTVVEIRATAFTGQDQDCITLAISALQGCEACEPKDKVGIVSYDPSLWTQVAPRLGSHAAIVGAVLYDDASSATTTTLSQKISLPMLQHFGGKDEITLARSPELTMYQYPEASSYLFASPFQDQFIYSVESVSHTRNLTFLKKLMDGPYFDLEAIWDDHTYWEFERRSVEHTMATMVQEPYVNHVPTITGGIGRAKLTEFYRDHFIFANPDDTALELISRTVGIDRVMDEFLFKCTHDRTIDWLLPGVPPTHRKLALPFTAVVNIRGDRLYHEHIAWDQLSALFQAGLMPEYLPFPYPVANGHGTASGKGLEYRVPGAGLQTADKMREKMRWEAMRCSNLRLGRLMHEVTAIILVLASIMTGRFIEDDAF